MRLFFKSSILLIMVLTGSNAAIANERTEKVKACKTLMGAALFNGLLEEECGFNGGVKSKLKAFYFEGRCDLLLTEKDRLKLTEAVFKDTDKRLSAYGHDVFCEENMQPYADLVDKK